MTNRHLWFRGVSPRPWAGRYRRVPGEARAFHIERIDGEWRATARLDRDGYTGTCILAGDGDSSALVAAVNGGKAAQGAPPGGAFLVDEYGRVLVPSADGVGSSVFVVGECGGPLLFADPFEPGSVFDLYDDADLEPGDLWDRPYVGIRYQLSKYGELYYWDEEESGAEKLLPSSQDERLIASIRAVRGEPWGAVRFLVGPGGVVLTKRPPDWEPCYVGRLDFDLWFPKEVL